MDTVICVVKALLGPYHDTIKIHGFMLLYSTKYHIVNESLEFK